MRALLRKGAIKRLPAGYDVDTHFNPAYEPWDQRMCLVPDGDLFAAIGSGKADVVTDHIEAFTATGLRLRSGATLDADVVVTATGLNLLLLGGIELTVDGEPVHGPEHVAYKAMMLDGVPNLAFALGYTNASWTLKVDLVSSYVTRLLAPHARARVRGRHAEAAGRADGHVAVHRDDVRLLRAFPGRACRCRATGRRGGCEQHYRQDAALFRGPVDDGALEFRCRPQARPPSHITNDNPHPSRETDRHVIKHRG